MPEIGQVVHTWTPAHGQVALAEIEPLVELLGLHCQRHPELWSRVHAAEEALRGRDGSSMLAGLGPYQRLFEATFRLSSIAKEHPTADRVVIVQLLHIDVKGANFWIHGHGRDGSGGAERHEGTWEELSQKGFDCTIEGDGPNAKFTLEQFQFDPCA